MKVFRLSNGVQMVTMTIRVHVSC